VTRLGFNYRMGEMQAALGVEQIKRMPGFLEKRKKRYDALSSALNTMAGIDLFRSSCGGYESGYYCLSVILERDLAGRRLDVIRRLRARGVGTSIYYPQPVPRMTYYREKYGYDRSMYPVAERISDHSIALPVGPHLAEGDVEYVADSVGAVIKEVRDHD